MPALLEYDEPVRFRVYPNGIRILIPSDGDLATLRAQVFSLEEQLERLEEMPDPGDVTKARLLFQEKAGAELDVLKAKVLTYETNKTAQIEGLRATLWGRTRKLLQAEELSQEKSGADWTLETVWFRMREFSFQEQREADEAHTELRENGQGGYVAIMTDAQRADRNLDLLGRVLVGEYVLGDAHGKLLEGKRYCMEECAGPKKLQSQVAQTLIERMWTRNAMAPEMADFLSPRPASSRLMALLARKKAATPSGSIPSTSKGRKA